jgi:hypothetical protein
MKTASNSLYPRISTFLLLCMLVVSSLGIAFAEKKSRDFFAPKGIAVGTPSVDENGACRIPIKFETAIVHSAIWIDMVHTSVVGKEIRITADYRLTGGKNRYKGYIALKGLAAGTYELKYLDPKGKLHPIGPVTLP